MKPPRHWSPLSLWLIAAATFLVTVGIGIVVDGSSASTGAETDVVVAVNSFHSAVLDAIAQSINVGFGPTFAPVLAAIGIIAAGVLGRSWLPALRMGLLLVVPWGIADVVKVVVQRPRPDMSLLSHPILVEPTSFSYPSGHTAFAAALGMSVVMMLAGWRYRAAVLTLAIGVAVLTGWSRMYLGAHYPSDVLASLVLVPALSLCVSALMGHTRLAARTCRTETVTVHRSVVDSWRT